MYMYSIYCNKNITLCVRIYIWLVCDVVDLLAKIRATSIPTIIIILDKI